uniref:CUB domain-containing protein n=1 Tax=Timema douglasi TaxID=61478 RepID=A0A7R8Z7Z6_TIMDO|nr:unnamed protein product [Timema douglasi]
MWTENVTSGTTLAPPYEDLTGCDTWTRVVTITDGYAIDVTVESMDVGQDDYLTINAVHPTEIRTSISLSSAVEQLITTNALANYATEAVSHDYKGGHDSPDSTLRSPADVDEGVYDAIPYSAVGMARSVVIADAPDDHIGKYGSGIEKDGYHTEQKKSDLVSSSRRLSAIAIMSLPSYPSSYIAVEAKNAGMEESEGWGLTLYEVLEGGRRLVDTSVPVFTGKIRTPRKIRALTSTAVFIEFVAQPSNDTQYTGFTLTFQKYGEITTSTETSTEASTLPVAPQSVNAEFTVYLSGLTPVVEEGTQDVVAQVFNQGSNSTPLLIRLHNCTQKKKPSPCPHNVPAQDNIPKTPMCSQQAQNREFATSSRPESRRQPRPLTFIPFAQNITEFKTAVKGMAVSFCTVNNINIIDNITEKNVIISYAVQCPITWPNSDKCVQVTMSIPVVVLNDTAYEMTTIHLYQMWNQYSARDTLLQELGLKVYSVPRTEVTMYTWMGVSLGCLAIFAIILVMVWRLDIFANHSESSGVSESQPKMSTTSQKSWIELPYQEFPPMGVDDFPEYEPDNLHTGKGAHINLHPLPSPTPKLPSYGPPQEYGAALHFFPTSFDNQALIEEDDDIYQKHDRNTSTS